MTRLLLAFTIFLLASFGSRLQAATSLVMPDHSSVLVAGEDGELRLWGQGEEKPRWQLRIGGIGEGARSRVAAITVRPSGEIIVVERLGDILAISADGRLLSRYTPVYEYVRLSVDFSEVDWSNWQDQVDVIAHTSASFITDDSRYLYLVPDDWSVVRKVAIDDLLRQPSGVVMLTDTLVFQFKDRNFTIDRKLDTPKFSIGKGWVVGESSHVTSLSVCGASIIAGTNEGEVYFIPEDGDTRRDQRVRQVGNADQDVRSILDAACLGSSAVTVSFEAGNGQIQLWDLRTKAVFSTVGSGTGGHPGMAFTAIPSKSGSVLLSLGDGDLRLWSVSDGKLKLIAKHYPDSFEGQQNFAAAPLDSGGFVFWSAGGLFKVGEDGNEPVLYAGRKTESR